MGEPGNRSERKTFVALAAIIAVAAAALSWHLSRPLWFDEALTVLEFVGEDNFFYIYLNYPIPNNHIVFNWALLAWCRSTAWLLPPGEFSFRIFGLALALALALAGLAFWLWRRRLGSGTAALAIACLCLSPAFAIHGVAARGYQLSAIFVLLALHFGRRWRDVGGWIYGAGYFMASLLAVGTIPSNILALAAIPLLPDKPPTPGNVFTPRRIWLVLAPPLAFAVFYLPIGGQLLAATRLPEGWDSPLRAITHFYAAAVLAMAPLLVMIFGGLIAASRQPRRPPIGIILATTALLALPALAMTLRSPAPFPRAFYPIWIVWIFTLGMFRRRQLAAIRLRHGMSKAKQAAILPWVILGATVVMVNFNLEILAGWLTPPSHHDDYFRPYYLAADFAPEDAVEAALEISGGVPGTVFLDSNADHQSIIFYGRTRRGGTLAENHWLFDRPGNQVVFEEPPRTLFIVATNASRAAALARRFNIPAPIIVADIGFQKIYYSESSTNNPQTPH